MPYKEIIERFPIPCWVRTPSGALKKIQTNKITVSKYHVDTMFMDDVVVYCKGIYAVVVEQ